MSNFDFLENSLGIVSPPKFVYDFLRKMFLKFHSNNWPVFIAWLSLLHEILVIMCIAIVVNQTVTSSILKLIVFFYLSCFPKNSRQKSKYLDNEKSF